MGENREKHHHIQPPPRRPLHPPPPGENPAPYQSLNKIDINGIWIQRLANGQQVLKAGTYQYRNHYENTNTPLPTGQTIDVSAGVVSAQKPPGTFDDGKYHHYLMVRSSGIVSAYLDGELIGTDPNTNPTVPDAHLYPPTSTRPPG